MPRDVATRWNSTYNMLHFAIEYRKAIDAISGDREMELHKFELAEYKWKIATQLWDVLKVREGLLVSHNVRPSQPSDFEGHDLVLFSIYPKSCHCYTGNRCH
jgi:hypothetical protein